MNIVVNLNIDFALLLEQKMILLDLCERYPKLEGIVSLIDDIQDQAVDKNGMDEKVVFGCVI